MRVLVTGGAGFIGSHLAHRLLADNHEVLVLDNECTGKRDNVPPSAKYTRGDVCQQNEIEPLFQSGLDAVCHLAAQVSIIQSFSDPMIDLRTNVEGTLNILRLVRKYRVSRLVYASSMTIHGDRITVPTPETAPVNPNSYYGITKYAAERYIHATAERNDLGFPLHVTSLRMFSVYGPGQPLDNPYQGVLGIFLGNMLTKKPIAIYGDGEQTRDFVYIDDVVDAWVKVLTNPASFGEVYNIGSGRSMSINELAKRVIKSFNLSPDTYPIHHKSPRPGEQRDVRADITKARSVLSWEPRINFLTGLEQTLQWTRRDKIILATTGDKS